MPLPAYQDWSKYGAPGGDVAFSDVLPATTIYNGPLFDTSAWHHVVLTFQNLDTVAYLTAIVNWTGFGFTTLSVPFDQIVVGPSQLLSYAVPVRGRSCQITAQVVSGVPTRGFQYNVMGAAHRIEKYEAKQAQGPLISTALVFAGIGNQTQAANYWFEGRAKISLASSAGAMANAVLEYWDIGTATWQEYLHLGVLADTAVIPYTVPVPPAPMRVHVFNQTGTAQTIRVHMIPEP